MKKIKNQKSKIQTWSYYLIIFTLLGFGILSLGFDEVYAQDVTTTITTQTGGPTQLQSNIGGISIGYIKVGTKEVGTAAWHPDFKIGPWGMGADVNIPLGKDAPDNYQNAVLRYLEYDDSKKGLRYGILDNVTWGHGMILDNYSTRLYDPSPLLHNEQLAFKGYVDMDSYVVRGLATRSNIYGIRVEERINPMLTLGQTYVTDTDGITPVGTTSAQKVSAVGIDASVPLPLNFEGFAEYAQLVDHGSGFGAGVSWGYDLMVASATFLAEYRMMDKGFVPGYFDADYEYNPINLASAEASGNVKNGYVAKLGISALGLASLNVAYENYNDSNSSAINADLFAKLPQDV
ncbi:MAG: hypothetical protein ABIA67_03785, partial [Candidatus Margulisiibacteriota bacterium]